MKKKSIKKLEVLLSFVNNICDIVCNPEEHLNPNCKDSPYLYIGYCLDDKNNPIVETNEGGDSPEDLEDTLNEITNLVRAYSRVDYSKEWAELQE